MKMRHWILMVMLLLAFCISKSLGQAHIEFDSMIFDFKRAAAGEIVEHTFVFTNTGNQTLEISDVRPTCGCTVAGAWDRRVEPGKIGTIPVRYTPKYDDQDVHKTVIVCSNDSGKTNIILQIVGKIWEPIEVDPAFVMFGVTADSQTSQVQTIHIVNNGDQPLTLLEPMSADRSLKASIKTVRPGKEFELQIALVPPLKPGSTTIPITVKASSTALPLIEITAFVSVKPRIAAIPSRITLPPGPLGSALETNISIQNNGRTPIHLTEPVADVAGIKLELKEIKAGWQYTLVATFPKKFLMSSNDIAVRIKTDDLGLSTVAIPIFQNKRLSTMLEAGQ